MRSQGKLRNLTDAVSGLLILAAATTPLILFPTLGYKSYVRNELEKEVTSIVDADKNGISQEELSPLYQRFRSGFIKIAYNPREPLAQFSNEQLWEYLRSQKTKN